MLQVKRLTVAHRSDLAAVIRQALAEFSGCIISVSHDRLYLEEVCSRVLELTSEGLAER